MRMRVVADCFQHSTKIIARHFKEVRRALCQLAKILIRPCNMSNEVPLYIANNPKHFPWFKVISYLYNISQFEAILYKYIMFMFLF